METSRVAAMLLSNVDPPASRRWLAPAALVCHNLANTVISAAVPTGTFSATGGAATQ